MLCIDLTIHLGLHTYIIYIQTACSVIYWSARLHLIRPRACVSEHVTRTSLQFVSAGCELQLLSCSPAVRLVWTLRSCSSARRSSIKEELENVVIKHQDQNQCSCICTLTQNRPPLCHAGLYMILPVETHFHQLKTKHDENCSHGKTWLWVKSQNYEFSADNLSHSFIFVSQFHVLSHIYDFNPYLQLSSHN